MIIVDVEASGTDYAKHSVVSVGALDFDNPTNQFYEECRLWDGAHVMKEALSVNGFSEEEIRDATKKSEGELAASFLAWGLETTEHTFAGQNPSFDRDFLRAAAVRAHLDWPFAYRTIDVHSLCYMHMVKRGLNIPSVNKRSALDLDAIMRYVGIPDEPSPHNALTGALAHAEVISRLLYDRKMLPEFKTFEIPWQR